MSVHEVESGWAVRWRQGGKQRSRTFDRTIGFRREDAEHFDHVIKRHKRRGGVDPLASERDFWDVAKEWWRGHHDQVSPMTRTNQRGYLEQKIAPAFDRYRLCDVKPLEIESWMDEMEREGVGRESRRKSMYVLSGVFDHAVRMGYMENNPVRYVKKPKTGRQRIIQPFPPERVEALRGWFLERGDLESATLVSVLAYAGPRPAEAHTYLAWGDILGGSIIFRANKTQRDRTTRLLAPLAEDLALWRTKSPHDIGPVFGWTVSRFNNWRGRYFKRAVKDLDIGPTRPYDLRHAYASLLAAEGRSIDHIARELGHSHPTCTRWYRHFVEDADTHQSAEERIREARAVPQMFPEQKTNTP